MKKENDIGAYAWKGLAEEAVARSIAKLARISSGNWELKDIEVAVSAEALKPAGDQDGAGVIFTVSGPGSLRSLITFRPGDVEVISRCFLGYSFVKMSSMNKAEELLISEVGNILFNSFLSVNSARTGEMSSKRLRAIFSRLSSCMGLFLLLSGFWDLTLQSAR